MSNLARIEALTSRIKNMREKAQKGARIGTGAVLTGGGGLFAGFIDAKMPKVPNTNLDTAALTGAGGVLVAMSGFLGEHSEHVGQLAAGVLAYALGRESKDYFS